MSKWTLFVNGDEFMQFEEKPIMTVNLNSIEIKYINFYAVIPIRKTVVLTKKDYKRRNNESTD